MLSPVEMYHQHRLQQSASEMLLASSPDSLTPEQVNRLRLYQGSFDLKRNPQAVDLLIAE